MKNKLRKIVIMMVCSSMMAVSLTGCMTKGGSSSNNSSSANSGSEDTDIEKDSADIKENIALKVGIARDTAFEYQGEETADSNAWIDLYTENGITLDVLYEVDLSQKVEKLAQSIMAGDYPDLMQVDSNNFSEWAEQGIFADLTEGFELYASDELKEYYGTEAGQRALQAATIDGKLYGLPGVPTPNDNMPILWIRKDWLDNLGLDVPKTVEEFYQVAKAFTEEDPDQNGEDDTYGIAFNGKDVFQQFGDFATYFEMFGAQPGHYTDKVPFIDIDGKAAYGGTKVTEMKEGLTLLQKMYDEGLISKDFVTSGQDQIIQDMAAGKVGMAFNIFYGAEHAWTGALETQPDANFISVAIPGLTENDRGQAFYSTPLGESYTMSSKCENMEAFFTVINLGLHYLGSPDKLSQEEYEMYNGLAGKYTGSSLAVAALGQPFKNMNAYEPLQNALASGDTSELNSENLRDFEAMMVYVDNRDRRDELSEDELGQFNAGVLYWSVWGNEGCAYQTLHEMDSLDNYLYSAYDSAPTEKMSDCSTSLITLTKETIVDIVVGNKPIDEYDNYLDQWYKLGGEEITAEADAWYQTTITAE